MALPRLSFGGPIIFAFSWSNGIPRLWATCTAETNWPRFLNCDDAKVRSVPFGSRLCSLAASLVLSANLSPIEDDELLPVLLSPAPPPLLLPMPCMDEDDLPCPPPCWASTDTGNDANVPNATKIKLSLIFFISLYPFPLLVRPGSE